MNASADYITMLNANVRTRCARAPVIAQGHRISEHSVGEVVSVWRRCVEEKLDHGRPVIARPKG